MKMIANVNTEPLVSIYLPTKNRSGLLVRAVKSLINQTYKNIEIIIINDGSNDDTKKIINQLSNDDSRVKSIHNKISVGGGEARNQAIKIAKGDFITGLDDDDFVTKNHIDSMLRAWKKKQGQNTVAIFPLTKIIKKTREEKKILRPKRVNSSDLLHSNFIGNQIFLQTSVLRSIGGFSQSMPAWQDLECWYRLLCNTSGVAYSSGEYSYICDISHENTRISDSKKQIIDRAFIEFCKMNKLSGVEKMILSLQRFTYYDCSVSGFMLLAKLRHRLNYFTLRQTIWILAKQLKIF